MTDRAPDARIENHGSIVLLRANGEAAHAWIAEHLPEDRMEFCGAVVIEPRYVGDIVDGMTNDGLEVR